MDSNNKKHLIVYFFIAGFVFYLLSAALSAIFIVALPQDRDWCLSGSDIEIAANDDHRFVCYQFKSAFEELKYYHNKSMVQRNSYVLSGNILVAIIVTVLAFHFIPKWKGKELASDNFISAVFLAFLISVIAPLFFSWLLPPPAEWFPQIFKDINDAQVERELEILRSL